MTRFPGSRHLAARSGAKKHDAKAATGSAKLLSQTGPTITRNTMQSKRHSIIESITNVAVGYVVALVSQLAVFPMFDIHIPLSSNMGIGLWFTGISIVRSYAVRRVFTHRTGG